MKLYIKVFDESLALKWTNYKEVTPKVGWQLEFGITKDTGYFHLGRDKWQDF